MSNQKLAAALQMFVSLAELRRDELGALSPEMSECVAAGRDALAEHGARTFSDDVADMVERAGAILRSQVCSITQVEKLVAFMRAGHNVAQHAFENSAYQEPQA